MALRAARSMASETPASTSRSVLLGVVFSDYLGAMPDVATRLSFRCPQNRDQVTIRSRLRVQDREGQYLDLFRIELLPPGQRLKGENRQSNPPIELCKNIERIEAHVGCDGHKNLP